MIRAAKYATQHTQSPELNEIAKYHALPKYYLRRFTDYAWQVDRDTFFKAVADPEIRGILLSSYKIFSRDPKIFLKSLLLFATPELYYRYRKWHGARRYRRKHAKLGNQ